MGSTTITSCRGKFRTQRTRSVFISLKCHEQLETGQADPKKNVRTKLMRKMLRFISPKEETPYSCVTHLDGRLLYPGRKVEFLIGFIHLHLDWVVL